jgi:predicted deacetylase
MSAQFLIRFDDICPTMNWTMWSRIEAILLEFKVSPIIAVIPDNRDAKLMLTPPRADFWAQVRAWQARGWTIGLHGHQHVYTNRESGILGFTQKSEFAGIQPEAQEGKLSRAMEIFRRESVTPDIWVAPAHSFDQSTLSALGRVGLRVISDGFAVSPHTDRNDMFWVPQQLWTFRWRPFGVWTVCYHHNSWSEKDIARFGRDLERYRPFVTDLTSIKSRYESRRRRLVDSIYSRAHTAALIMRRRMRLAA